MIRLFKKLFSIVLLCIFSILIPSCEIFKDPLYVGTWQRIESIDTGDLVFNTTRTLVLTQKSYEEEYLIQRAGSDVISAILGQKGTLSVKGSRMTFSLKELGTCITDSEDKCTPEVEWYGKGTSYYEDNIQYFRQTITGEFEAGEETLILKRDNNGDGDMEDVGEDLEFTRI